MAQRQFPSSTVKQIPEVGKHIKLDLGKFEFDASFQPNFMHPNILERNEKAKIYSSFKSQTCSDSMTEKVTKNVDGVKTSRYETDVT